MLSVDFVLSVLSVDFFVLICYGTMPSRSLCLFVCSCHCRVVSCCVAELVLLLLVVGAV